MFHRKVILLIGAAHAFLASPLACGDAGSTPLVVYGESGQAEPVYRLWNGTAWDAEANLPSFGAEGEWMVARNCPQRDETAVAVLDADIDLNLSFFDGASWTAPAELTIDTELKVTRPVDIAYEQQSGELLIVYWIKAEAKMGYRTWDGTTLSGESLLALPIIGKVRYMALTPKPGSDEIMFVHLNDDNELYACVWDGSGWGAMVSMAVDVTYRSQECFSMVYESQSGDGMIVFQEAGFTAPRYRTWDGSSWSAAANLPDVGAEQRYIRAVADPASDEILMATVDQSKVLTANAWNGSAWGANAVLEPSMKNNLMRSFDIAYEHGGGGALVMYGENGLKTPRYRTWDGSSWSAEQTASDLGQDIAVVQLRSGVNAGEVFALVSDNGVGLHFFLWDGSAMSANTLLEASHSGPNDQEPFMIAVPSGAAAPPIANLLMVVVDPLSLTAQESARKTEFESLGYAVTLIDESDTQGNFDTAVAANDVAYVPEDVGSTNLASKLVAAPIGVVIEESDCYDEFGLTAAGAGAETDDDVTILNYDHYITEPFSAGSLTICTIAQAMNKVTQSIARGGQVLADWPGGGHALIALDAGGKIAGGSRATGRRVFLPVGDNAFDWSALNADGLTIVERSLEWSRGLMAHWKLDETSGTTAADSIGGYDATLTSMDPGSDWVDGRIDGGLDFDGVNDHAITTDPFTPPAEGTVSFWMKVPGSPVAQGRILGLDDTWEIRHVTTGTVDGIAYGLVFDLGWSGVNTGFVTTTTVDAAGKWYFVAATYNTSDGAYSVYLDGTLHTSGTGSLAVPGGNQLTIGTRTGSNYFVGELDDLRVSNLQMGADEIASLHAQTVVRIISWQEVDPNQ